LLLALAAPAVLVYRDHARLRVQAADLIEAGVTLASEEIAKWRARSASPPGVAETRVAPVTAQDGAAAAPTVATIEPVAAAPAGSTAASAAPQAVPAEPAPPELNDATAAAALPLPTSPTAAPAGPARFMFAERTVTVGEGETSARIVIRRSGSLAEEASVAWWTADRSALADEDYAVLGARIETFAPGEESRAVHVPLVADSRPEQRETFVVNLRSEGTGSASQVEVVVLDDDF
jgi:hypothetical protein